MTGLNMSATVGEGMEISLASVVGSNVTFDGDKFMDKHPKDTAEEIGWKSAVVVDNYYSDIGKLKPASSINGETFFDATDASNSGKTAKKFEEITPLSDNMAEVSPRNTYSDTVDQITSDGEVGYYVDIPVHLRTSKASAGNYGQIDYKMVITPNSPTGTTDDELYKAVRVSFIPITSNTGSSIKIFTCDDLNNYYEKGTSAGKAVKDANTKAEISILDKSAVVDGTTIAEGQDKLATVTAADSGLKIPYASSAGTYGHLDFYVRVWIEGESTSCYDAKAGQAWNIDMAFSLHEST